MTKNDIVEMAKKAGFMAHQDSVYTNHRYGDCKLELEAFAKLVAEREREECAKFFDDNDTLMFWGSQVAREIRARQ